MTCYNGLDYETQAVSIPTYDRDHFGDFLAYENDATVYNGELDGWTTNYVLFYGKAYSTSHPVTVDGSYYMKRGDEITYSYSRGEYYSGGVLIQNQDDIPEETRIALRDRAIQTDPVALEDQITQGQGRMAIGTAELLKSIKGVKNVGNQ